VKQYLYYISGDSSKFDRIIYMIKKFKGYKLSKEVERSKDTLLLLVVLDQKSYIQNVIQKYNGFFIDLHTVYEGYEYWHVGIVNKDNVTKMLQELAHMGKINILYMGEVDFSHKLLSPQQKKIFDYAYEQGYYDIPRRINIDKVAKALRLNHSTAGEHLLKAENKIINSYAKKI
jgi:predicted DNA binding protein